MNEKIKTTARLLWKEDELSPRMSYFGNKSKTENTFNEVYKGGEQD